MIQKQFLLYCRWSNLGLLVTDEIIRMISDSIIKVKKKIENDDQNDTIGLYDLIYNKNIPTFES